MGAIYPNAPTQTPRRARAPGPATARSSSSRVGIAPRRYAAAAERASIESWNWPSAAVAVEAEDAAHLAGLVLVVDVLRIRPTADRADPALQAHQLVELVRTDPVAPLQVVVTTSAVEPLLRLLPLRALWHGLQ